MSKLKFLFLIFFFIQVSISVNAITKSEEALNEVSKILKEKYIHSIDENELTDAMLFGIFSQLDEYSDFFNKNDYAEFLKSSSGQIGGIGIEIARHEDGIKIISALDDSPAQRAGIKTNDVITHIDGKEIELLSLLQISKLIQGKIGSTVEFSIKSKYPLMQKILRIKREKINIKSAEILQNPYNKKIPILKIKSFTNSTPKDVENAIKFIKSTNSIGLIIDLQNNPGGLLNSTSETISFFIPENIKIASIVQKNGNQINILTQKQQVQLFKLPITILINNGSASGSEIFASALKNYNRANLIGQKTYGKGVVQDIIELESKPDSAIKLTIAYYQTSNGQNINKLGIKPDIQCQENCDIIKTANASILANY